MAALAAVTTAGCQVDEELEAGPELAVLEREPIATLTPPGGTLVLDNRLGQGTALGKPVDAEVVRVFAFDDAPSARAGRGAVVDAARASGWRIRGESLYPGVPLFGAKTLATGDTTLSVGKYVDEGVHKVSVQLEHTRCPRDLCGGP